MKNIESNSNNLDYNISSRNAEKIWKKIVERPGGMIDITYLSGGYTQKIKEGEVTNADIRLYKKGKREAEGYFLYINDITIPNAEVIMDLLHQFENEGLLIKSVGVQASHKKYDQMREELIQKWDKYLQSLE